MVSEKAQAHKPLTSNKQSDWVTEKKNNVLFRSKNNNNNKNNENGDNPKLLACSIEQVKAIV